MLLILDAILLFLNYKIIKNKQFFCQYLPSKYKKSHKCGSKIKIHDNHCPKCLSLLTDKEYGIEEANVQETVNKFPSDKKFAKPVESIEESSELEEDLEQKSKV
ncbi:MAG: hypothetical protein ACFFA0_05130 [Promethearchaeota archaeon]